MEDLGKIDENFERERESSHYKKGISNAFRY